MVTETDDMNQPSALSPHRFCVVAIIGVVLVGLFTVLTRPFQLRVIACDVGQGDALLAIYGSRAILIDSGPNKAILDCLAKKMPFGQVKLMAAILTHWDADHIGGFSDVVLTYTVGSVFANPKKKETKIAQAALDAAMDSELIHPFPGDELILPGGRWRFLWSAGSENGVNSGNGDEAEENATSIGVQGAFKGFGFLSLGDLECREELAVASLPLLIPGPILKVSHHGSKTSSCPHFLAKIRPEMALVSVGAGNRYGHPDGTTVQNFKFLGVPLLRTDLFGSLELQRRGEQWLVSTGKSIADWLEKE